MHELTIKFEIADKKNLHLLTESTTKHATTGSTQGIELGTLNRRSILEILLYFSFGFIL